jgi:hypothetical protein
MIRVNKGLEPDELKTARDKCLKAAVDEFNAGGTPWTKTTARIVAQKEDLLSGYDIDEVRSTLFLRQHKKCAYCEGDIRLGGNPVEHFRPKAGAWRHARGAKKAIDHDCYWWLTWTWENLLLACVTCNGGNHKGNYFPLATAAVCRPRTPIGWPPPKSFASTKKEQPLFLNPTWDDPLDHLEWVPLDRSLARKLWAWTLSDKTTRGKAMRDWMKLDHIADAVTRRLRGDVLPTVVRVEKAIRQGQVASARQDWKSLLKNVLDDPESPYRAAIWCALEIWVPRHVRTQHGLKHPTRP